MRIGAMRDRVRLQSPTQSNPVADTYGLAEAYSDVCEIWADVQQLAAEKRYMDLSGQYWVRYKVEVRFRDDIAMTSRLVFGSRYLYVNDIVGDAVAGEMTLMCYERATS